jgi:DNA-binding XRE family transcriptional regulator
MNAIKLLAETPETVTISRADLEALIDAAENAEDIASVRAWNAFVAAAGRDTAIANSYTAAEAKRLLAGESPLRIWREKRGLTQRALAAAAAIPAGYLNEIERGKKPGSVAAYRTLAATLAVPIEDLVGDE